MTKIEKLQEVYGCSLEIPSLTPAAEGWAGVLRPKLIFWQGRHRVLAIAKVSLWEDPSPKEDRWVSQVFVPMADGGSFDHLDQHDEVYDNAFRRSPEMRPREPLLEPNETRSPRPTAAEGIKVTLELIADFVPKADTAALTATAAFIKPQLEASTRFYLAKIRPARR